MGRKYGHITKNGTGLVTYALSPHEQKAFPFLLKKVIPNTLRRFSGKWPVLLVPMGVFYWTKWAGAKSEYYNSKEYLAEHPE
ncbi:Cytochrome b-c1 complex subunit 8 [Mizuhopecten yessoensis]|uniref:Cytochrome b-c1 complex subunit 8 n=1 Tax=Mizuhopecten yessoensis TaxID=6573 RepID=A0A210Q6B0_MIZYE|nr:Cytochrome b-c1 complex subunit 8 [Mizuhopecten yessoensis]